MGSPFRLHREAKDHTGRSVENFQDVIATSTTVFACGALLIRKLKAAIAGVAFGTSDVGYLHLSLGFCRSFRGDQPPNREKPVAFESDRFGAIVPVTTSLRDSIFTNPSSRDSQRGANQNYFKRVVTQRSLMHAHPAISIAPRDPGSNAAVLNRYLMAALNVHSDVVFPDMHQEINKMKFALIGAAAVAAAAFVTPALAQDVASNLVTSNRGYCAQYPNANCWNLGPGGPYADGGYGRADWRNAMAAQALDNSAYRYHGGPKYND